MKAPDGNKLAILNALNQGGFVSGQALGPSSPPLRLVSGVHRWVRHLERERHRPLSVAH